MSTVEQALLDLGRPADGQFACHCCNRLHPAFALAVAEDGPGIVIEERTEERALAPDPANPETPGGSETVMVEVVTAPGATCTGCLIDRERECCAVEEAEEAARIAAEAPWETPLGVETRMERNRRIENARWAADPVTSPLSLDCQQLWVDHIRTLNRITLDFSDPADVVWPEQPPLEYPNASD